VATSMTRSAGRSVPPAEIRYASRRPSGEGNHASRVVRPEGSMAAGSTSTRSAASGPAASSTSCSRPGPRRVKNRHSPRHAPTVTVPAPASSASRRSSPAAAAPPSQRAWQAANNSSWPADHS
jgi:hypothetical protein